MEDDIQSYYGPREVNNHKQVIVMRNDLNMRTGKMIAQGAHASMKAILDQSREYKMAAEDKGHIYIDLNNYNIGPWLKGLFTKVCVQTSGADALHALVEQAIDLKIPYALILDSGKTEFKGVPTYTCCAIGPAAAEVVDQITGSLKLL